MNPKKKLQSSLDNARKHLLAERNKHGCWEGELSTSALSTATAVIALHTVDPTQYSDPISHGLQWLVDHQNEDGGWGDTTISLSNISTTLLCWSALNLVIDRPTADTVNKAERWIENHVGSLDTDAIVGKVVKRYGKDRTFSVPILMACAICGRLGDDPDKAWKQVLPLPFELAAFPKKWFAILQLPVVSYALPALIAIGYARYVHVPPFFPIRLLKKWAWGKASQVLQEIHPESGGYLEATPLTSFVTMALASSGQGQHPVVSKAVDFLLASIRPDGSWPIDTNLATWATTLSVKALACGNEKPVFSDIDSSSIRHWLLQQQYLQTHAFTNAPPGGWAWTDLPGGVPDADDTAGALLALRCLGLRKNPACDVALAWLLNLQNRDGGIPTFCRGWGALPFDRSSPDLTAHALRAWIAWMHDVPPALRSRVRLGIEKGLDYLRQTQADDGCWIPLWFGNQHLPDENNPTYGTSMVLQALAQLDTSHHADLESIRKKALHWLIGNQNTDGGWGGGSGTSSSIEETALALDALCSNVEHADGGAEIEQILTNASERLIALTKQGTQFPPSPIGFYFAKLWYHEKVYPVVWTVSALGQMSKRLSGQGFETLE